jgi:hypothetical protein
MTNKELKQLSGNEISELLCMIGTINSTINDFCHVSENLPKSISNQLDKLADELNKELDYREDI